MGEKGVFCMEGESFGILLALEGREDAYIHFA